MIKTTTICFIERGGQVLLAMKKRGWGEGWWNGYGGKVEDGETIEEAAKRELKEESGVTAKVLREKGIMLFSFEGKDKLVETHIFEVTEYEGEPVETEEMKPKWFKKSEVPYNEMWPADKEWLPIFLEGKDFRGSALFDEEVRNFKEINVQIIEKEPIVESIIQEERWDNK